MCAAPQPRATARDRRAHRRVPRVMPATVQSVAAATKAIFTSRLVQTAANIRTKLSTAREAAQELRAQYPQLALEVASDEPGAIERMEALKGNINRAEDEVRLLETALQLAEKKEAERAAEAEAKADAARVRALAQHLGKMRVCAQQFERGLQEMSEGWAGMLDAYRRARALIPAPKDVSALNAVSPTRLSKLCTDEIQRIAYATEHPSQIKHPLPAAKRPMVWSLDKARPTLSDVIANRTAY